MKHMKEAKMAEKKMMKCKRMHKKHCYTKKK